MSSGAGWGRGFPLWVLLLLLSLCAWGQTTVKGNLQISGIIDVVGDGKIDWSKQEIRALGIGFAPKYETNTAKATVLAREAAIVAAERNLLKAINGVRITSDTTVRDLVVESDVIKTHVEGLLKNAVILSEKAMPQSNGYQVVMGIDLYGDKKCLAEEIDLPKQAEKAVDLILEKSAGKDEKPVQPVEEKNAEYTGLVIDCRGLSLVRSMCPRILDQTGASLWSDRTVSTEMINEKGMAGYFRTPDDPELARRVGKHPLLVKALRASGGKDFKTDAVLSPADFERVQTANEQALFLEKLNVAFLVDDGAADTEKKGAQR
jgi:hypothetical protein